MNAQSSPTRLLYMIIAAQSTLLFALGGYVLGGFRLEVAQHAETLTTLQNELAVVHEQVASLRLAVDRLMTDHRLQSTALAELRERIALLDQRLTSFQALTLARLAHYSSRLLALTGSSPPPAPAREEMPQ